MPARDSDQDKNSAPFDPNRVMQDFAQLLRDREKPVDLSISQETLRANVDALNGRTVDKAHGGGSSSKNKASAGAAPRASSQARPSKPRWNMDDVEDVEDISGRAHPHRLALGTDLPVPPDVAEGRGAALR
ncbi:MAG: hypothetical protein K2W93_04540, partial [Burkholderiaceae bacterium]|nr:hypothetical protein [Burkholderiaceae bacterium]